MTHSPTQQKVRDAMRPTKRMTLVQIAEATALQPSTAGRALSALVADQCVIHIPATHAREVDRWRAATFDERHTDDGFAEAAATAKPARKAPTPLRAEVAAFLASATEPVSAHRIGKGLGRSAGAVQNVLDRLVESGAAVQVTPKPRSYSAADGA